MIGSYAHVFERPLLPIRVKSDRHGCASRQPSAHKLIRIGPGTKATGLYRLVGEKMGAGNLYVELKFSRSSLSSDGGVIYRLLVRRRGEIPGSPGRDDLCCIVCIGFVGQQMIGMIKRDEALWMLGGQENRGSIVDANDLVDGRVKHKKCAVQLGNPGL